MEEERLKLVLGIALDNCGKILIVEKQKKEKNRFGVVIDWSLPGGKIDQGEELYAAVERELLEETGYKVKAIEQISKRDHPQFPVTIYYWKCEIVAKIAEIKDVEEIKQAVWVETKDVKKYIKTDFDPKVAEMLGI